MKNGDFRGIREHRLYDGANFQDISSKQSWLSQSDGLKYTEVTIMSKTHKRRNHTATFKKEVVLATFKGEKSIQQIAAEYEIHPDPVSKWKAQVARWRL